LLSTTRISVIKDVLSRVQSGMKPHNKLTESQKRKLAELEPKLKSAARLGQYDKAVLITSEIQAVLRPTGHEMRLQQAKAWLFEAALHAGNLQIAEAGFLGIRQKVSPRTRLYIEATSLLAICYIRQEKLREAEPLMAVVLHAGRNISSPRRPISSWQTHWVSTLLCVGICETNGISGP
jgi:hypothetical protein